MVRGLARRRGKPLGTLPPLLGHIVMASCHPCSSPFLGAMLSVIAGLLLTVNSQLIDWWRWMQKAAGKRSYLIPQRGSGPVDFSFLIEKHPESWGSAFGGVIEALRLAGVAGSPIGSGVTVPVRGWLLRAS